MFLRFSVENHRSLRDETVLNFISTSRSDAPTLRFPRAHTQHGVLPAVGIWGANATGKSNLVDALCFFRTAVHDSQARWRPTESIKWHPWCLNRSTDAAPTRMEIELLIGEVRYAFGFAYRDTGFVEEWLYRWETSRRQVLYHRDEASDDVWYFGPSFSGPKAQLTDTVRRNSLLLSAAAQANHPIALPVYTAIVDRIRRERTIRLSGYPVFHHEHPLLADGYRPQLLRLLQAADLGVSDVMPAQLEDQLDGLPEPMKQLLSAADIKRMEEDLQSQRFLKLIRGGSAPWSLPPEDESRGTQILLARLGDIITALSDGVLLVIDEIETSLHPDLCHALVGAFTSKQSNRRGAQLLFTTHDRGLLDTLRTDEIVLMDKRADGSTEMAAASDYRVRARDNLRLAHEAGRIGGVPVLGNLIELMGEAH